MKVRCRKCGIEIGFGKICGPCRRKWKEARMAAFNQAVAECGPLTADTHPAILKRIKQLERKEGGA